MLLHTREPELGLVDWHRDDRDRPYEPAGLPIDRLSGAAEQGDRRAQRVRARGRHPPGRRAEGAYDLRDHGRHHRRAASNSLVLGKHSGRHALGKALEEMGFEIDGQALNTAFKRFKEIADRKKQVTAMDLEALVTDELREDVGGYTLDWFEVEASSLRPPHARVSVTLPEGELGDRRVHRRRPDRRGLPGDQRRHRRGGEAQGVHHRRRHRGPGRAWRGLDRAGATTASRAQARASRRTSSTRPRGPMCERCRWPSPDRGPIRRLACRRRPRPDSIAVAAVAAYIERAVSGRPNCMRL